MNKARELEGFRAAHVAAVFVSIALFAPPAAAWNDAGHMVIAVAAYDALPASTQKAAVALLRAHPRFAQDFDRRMPTGLRDASAAQQNRWYFAHAATWPDLARRFDHVESANERDALVTRYQHGRWHYINLPTYLRRSDERILDVPIPSMVPPSHLEEAENLVQALNGIRAVLCTPTSDPPSRALALSWLLHLVGDLHQPLHSTALYAVDRLPSGDRGGNDIGVRGAANLHALWDGALGTDRRWRAVTARSTTLRDGTRENDAVDLVAWAMESREIAAQLAYSQSVRSGIEETPPGRPIRVRIDVSYRAAMVSVVETLAARAAARTARMVAEVVRDPVAPHCGG